MQLLQSFYFRRVIQRAAMLVLILMMYGLMQTWSQNSEPSLHNPSDTQTNSENLADLLMNLQSSQMNDLLNLRDYQTKQGELLTASLRDNAELMNLHNNSLMIIDGLENSLNQAQIFAEQAGERMQARDLDLYYAYQDIDELEDQVHELEKKLLRRLMVIIIMGAVVLGAIAFEVSRFIIKAKTGR